MTCPEEIGKFFTKQLSRLLISYAQTIKKQESIKGSLFAKPYKRVLIDPIQINTHIFYNLYLPERFKEAEDYRDYKYNSYSAIINNENKIIATEDVLVHYENSESFICFQEYNYYRRKILLKEFAVIDGIKERYYKNALRETEALLTFSKCDMFD